MPKQHILIVDDEPNLLESFKIGLGLKDYAVSIASGGKKSNGSDRIRSSSC